LSRCCLVKTDEDNDSSASFLLSGRLAHLHVSSGKFSSDPWDMC